MPGGLIKAGVNVTDKYYEYFEGPIEAPAFRAYAATPSESTDLPFVSRAIYVGTGGDLVVRMEGNDDDTPVTFANVPDGVWLPIRVRRIRTASTASDLVVMY
jgi:hypothetical protein